MDDKWKRSKIEQDEWLETDGFGGHVAEIADADPPHRPRRCPFQGWPLAELIGLDQMVLRLCENKKSAHPLGLKRHLTGKHHRSGEMIRY
jgi:glycogen debranching enzyme